MYLRRDARFRRRSGWVLSGVLAVWVVLLHWDVNAAPAGIGERARGIVNELEADASLKPLVEPAVERAKRALERAGTESASNRVTALEETALEWAEVGRDLARASAAEAASDRLEQELSALQTELAGVRAAVEQTKARVGRAQQDLTDLKATQPSSGVAPQGSAP
jgi:DNA repair exonuclease SbcCD ATPase subunit